MASLGERGREQPCSMSSSASVPASPLLPCVSALAAFNDGLYNVSRSTLSPQKRNAHKTLKYIYIYVMCVLYRILEYASSPFSIIPVLIILLQ